MQIGSFIELCFEKGKEYYRQEEVARLNSGRAAICHALRVLGVKTVWLPYYQCDSVRSFLCAKGYTVKYYAIDRAFQPSGIVQGEDDAVVLVNYFGIMSNARMRALASDYVRVIIDNAQAFFAPSVPNTLNVYSARKFVGVPDGAYVVGDRSRMFMDEYARDFSSDTANFLLERIEYGCEGNVYGLKLKNDERIDRSDILRMSKLTHSILDGINYEEIKQKRRENFRFACESFHNINLLDPERYYDDTCIPMVYPLVLADDAVWQKLINAKHFQGRWWRYLLDEVGEGTFEYWLSRYMIPITIDQRYGKNEIDYIKEVLPE